MPVSSVGNAEQDKSLTVNQARSAALTLANEVLRPRAPPLDRVRPGARRQPEPCYRVVDGSPRGKLLGRSVWTWSRGSASLAFESSSIAARQSSA